MWFGVLGPLVVTHDDVAITVFSGKPRVLLSALLVRPNRTVALESLAGALWEGDPPASAGVTIRNHVKRLRRALGPVAGERIVTRASGYAVEVADDECDLLAFGKLYRVGADAAHAGDWSRCAAALERALGMWRGELLADVPSASLRQTGAELAEMRSQAEEWRVEAVLRLGGSDEVVADLRRLVAADPLRERFQAQLMLALYRSGRQADALAVYQAAYRTLADELGITPGPGLRTLHAQVLEADPALLPPGHVRTLIPSRDEPAAPAPHSLTPRQLPAAPRYFAGRTVELEFLAGAAGQIDAGSHGSGALVISAITGTAGIGKTALALHWAHRIAGRFPDGQLYVNLRGFDPVHPPMPPAEAVRGFLDAFGVPVARIPADPEARAALHRSLLAGKRVLVVLDNARDAEQVRPLLPGSAGCLVLVTSRNPLTALAVAEGADVTALDTLTPAEARALLAERLPAGRVAGESDAVDALIELCAGLPLALGITAARAATRPGLPLAALAEELRDTRRRLDALAAGGEHADPRTVFSWSSRGLSGPAERMFRLLGLHVGPDISLPAAAALAGVPVARARRQLAELVRSGLLAEQSPVRFGFHDLLRAYAAEQAHERDPEPDRRAAIRRELDHYLHTAHAAALLLNSNRTPLRLPPPAPGAAPERLDGYDRALAWFQAEYRVLLAAVAAAAENGFDTHAWQLPWTLVTFQNRLGHWDDWVAVQRVARDAARRLGDGTAQADAERSLGRAALRRGDHLEAQYWLLQALDAYRRRGEVVGQADARLELARALALEERYAEALEHAATALGLYRDGADPVGPAYALNAMGWYHCRLGDYETAVRHCREALDLHRGLGDVSAHADTWDSLGYAQHRLGRPDEAVAAYENAARLYRQSGARYDLAMTYDRIGDAHATAGDPARAAEHWRRALAILDDLGHPDAGTPRAKLPPATEPGQTVRAGQFQSW